MEEGRRLIYFPIVHTEADMGKMRESIREAALKEVGRTALKRKAKLVHQMWEDMEKAIADLGLAYENVKLYQDGLPVCGREPEIVKELAEAGSLNHRLLLNLMDKGATLMGTESAELLVEEYQLIKQAMAGSETRKGARFASRQEALSDCILRKRDRFIGDRINSTLLRGETGILFLGMLHSLEEWLDHGIRVAFPINLPIGNRLVSNPHIGRGGEDRVRT
jgi:hypothetical protein